ncbi:MAG: hypothetical protein ACI81R_001892 [Bradymonadia bacterium]|jgi:hypothetical protein
MSQKKPVWVDEEAHSILKRYSKLVKSAMVDVASRLVVERLNDLDPASGLETSAPAPAPVLDTARPQATAPASDRPKKPARAKAPRPDLIDENTRFVGGIWIV